MTEIETYTADLTTIARALEIAEQYKSKSGVNALEKIQMRLAQAKSYAEYKAELEEERKSGKAVLAEAREAGYHETRQFFRDLAAADKQAWSDLRAENPQVTRFDVEAEVCRRLDMVKVDTSRPGMIGSGTKVHSLSVTFYVRNGVSYVGNAYSYCGSQRWSASGGRSGLRLLPEGTKITCGKCG